MTPNYGVSAKDRLLRVLEAHEGRWETVGNLMFDAGFVPTRSDPLIAYTSFYFNLCQLEDGSAEHGYQILRQGRRVMMVRKGTE
ncbi:hypothetical protein [Mesorhizobium silamurunense]|uniref:hypothetical protein n=1 Tax=Mesorhizobium silamurunense TaxID=499528 RepID=UPI00178325B9|nr:hypothetical protein [Mesorhizobium silamurunense]